MKSNKWRDYQDKLYSNPDLGFFLDYGHSGINDKTLSNFEASFRSAFDHMDRLEKGAIANPDENRQVGHYWLRNPDLAPSKQQRSDIKSTLDRIHSFSSAIVDGKILAPHNSPYTNVLLIGIGGSALGPQFITDALRTGDALAIDFIDNTDPSGIDRTLASLMPVLPSTLVLIISKSGGTAETRNGMIEVKKQFSQQGLDFSQQAVAITGAGSQLDKLANSENWLSIFPMWDWVGGRTSVMSAVGLLPAALTGIDIYDLLQGAQKMDILTRHATISINPAALLALTWLSIGDSKGSKDMVILPYRDKLILFSRYLQQLIMESIGKSHDLDGKLVNQGISVYGNKGSTDQHAYVQQLRDGLNNFFVTFIEVLKDRDKESILVDDHNTSGDYLFGFLKGTQTALAQNDRKSLTITISELSAESVGALIALYERAVGLYASVVNINAYHQPGVEAGKKAAGFVLETKNQILALLSQSDRAYSIADICQELDLVDQEILVYHTLRHHVMNNDLLAEGSIFEPDSLRVARLSS